jgi:hypothetical protein
MIASSPTWGEMGRVAAATVAGARHGSRDKALDAALLELKRLWPDRKVAKQTLRTAMLAAGFVDEMRASDADYARTLERLPAIAVETLCRWHHYDAARAKRHAKRYDAGEHSIRGLMDAEREARRSSTGYGRSGRSGRSLFEQDLPHLIEGYSVVGTRLRVVSLKVRNPAWSEYGTVPAAILSKVAPGILTLGEREPSTFPETRRFECALLVAGPYADAGIATSRTADWILRALGLTFYFSSVALVLASRPTSLGVAHNIPHEARGRFLLLVPPNAQS